MAGNRNLDALLKWSIEAQGQSASDGASSSAMADIAQQIESGQRPDLKDPELLQAIMGGKSEAQMMQEELAVALNDSRNVDDRVTALDNFEMLIEQIDNANNIKSMGMWPPLLSLLSSPEPEIQHGALWIIGTAVQNNDKAQMAVLDLEPLPAILNLLGGSHDMEVRKKALYALSSILKHNPKAVAIFDDDAKTGGWSVLRGALMDPNVALRRKAAFLVNTLLLQDDAEILGDAASTNSPRPVALLGPPPSSSSPSTTTTTTTTSVSSVAASPTPRSTAVAPSNLSAPLPSSGPASHPPLEQLPATLTSGVKHPSIPPALLRSNILQTLLTSLLPLGVLNDDESKHRPPPSGPDGDVDARDDVDYAEKSSRAVLSFVQRGGASQKGAEGQVKRLLGLVAKELDGKPAGHDAMDEGDDGRAQNEKRWQELGWDRAEWDEFRSKVQAA